MGEGLSIVKLGLERAGRRVLEEVSVKVPYGSVLAVLGRNGAGKTTLLEAMAGFHPFSGEVLLDGVPLASLSQGERARRIAYVPQRSRLEAPLPVRDVVAQGRFAHGRGWRRLGPADWAAVDEALRATDTLALRERPFSRLSGGERRRVLIARALATGARLLLLDEPSASLDLAQTLTLFALTRRLAEAGHAIVVVLHQLDEALRCADRALLLEAGRVVEAGPLAQVIAVEPVRRVYQVELIAQGGFGYRRLGSSA